MGKKLKDRDGVEVERARTDRNPHWSLQKFKLNDVTLVPFITERNTHLAQKLKKLKDNPVDLGKLPSRYRSSHM